MTVSTTDNRVSYATDGSSVDYPVTYPFLAAADLVVTFVNSGGAVSILSIGGDYTVAGGDNNTGTVTTTSPLAAGGVLLIVRDVPFTQPTDYVNNDKTDAEVQERALDRGCMLSQQLFTKTDRALRLNDAFTDTFSSELPLELTAGLSLKINDAGDGWDLGIPLTAASGQFLQRQVFSNSTLDDAGGQWIPNPSTKSFHLVLGNGTGGQNVSADLWFYRQLDPLESAYTGWTLGDGTAASPAGDMVIETALLGGTLTIKTGVGPGPYDGGPAGNGFFFDTSANVFPYLIIDEYN